VQYIGGYQNSMGSTPCGSNSLQLCTSALALAGGTAKKYNQPITAGSAAILKNADIVVGNWSTSGTFTPITASSTLLANAVQVTTRMSATTFFTPMLAIVASGAGFTSMSLTATATAAFTSTGVDTGGGRRRSKVDHRARHIEVILSYLHLSRDSMHELRADGHSGLRRILQADRFQ